jgi:hypothetical protein
VNYVYRAPQDYTLLLKLNITPPWASPTVLQYWYPPSPLRTVLVVLFFLCCVYAMCDCRPVLPVLARTLEEMFNLNDDYHFQLTNSSCLTFLNVNALFSLNNSRSYCMHSILHFPLNNYPCYHKLTKIIMWSNAHTLVAFRHTRKSWYSPNGPYVWTTYPDICTLKISWIILTLR